MSVKDVTLIAVDPGASGGIAIYSASCTSADPYKSDEQVAALVRNLVDNDTCQGDVIAYMEQVQGFIGKEQPGSSMFNFGNNYGFYRGLFHALGIPLRLIPPQKWMRRIVPGVIGMEKGERKRALKQFAQSRYPKLEVTLLTADSLVLLEYAREIEASGAAPVVIPSKHDFGSDRKRAKLWCKRIGWPVPSASAELINMVNYWRSIGCP